MLFNSIEYLFCFLPAVFIIYFLLNKFKFYSTAKIFLLAASIFFYGSYKWDYVYIIAVSVLLNYGISLILQKDMPQTKKRAVLVCTIAANIAALLFFKYFSFLKEAFADINSACLSTMEIILPLGISFFIIQQISYLIDCVRGRAEKTGFIDYALFVCFFPQLIAGPIVRRSEIIPQFNDLKKRVINQDNIYTAFFLITAGLLKKNVFADGFAPFIDYNVQHKIFNDFYTAWLLGITKAFQGYFDFSAYCDLALGSAFLFNISLPWNFNSPFQAENITDFWKRWNMTLMRFFRTYIYNPLGGNKKGMLITCRNILIVFALFGLWLGFNSMSIFYGIFNGILICINKIWQQLNIKINKHAGKILTFITVIFSVQLLAASSPGQFIRLVKSMLLIDTQTASLQLEGINLIFMPSPPLMVKLNAVLLISALITAFFIPNSNILAGRYAKADNLFYTLILAAVFIFAVLSITKGAEFIYFAF